MGKQKRVSVRSMLYRVVRELLVNVARHPEAGNVDIRLHRDEQGLRIAVHDDGRGFDPSIVDGQGQRGSFGILSVRERLARVGGALVLELQQGQAIEGTITIPLAIGQHSDGGSESIAYRGLITWAFASYWRTIIPLFSRG